MSDVSIGPMHPTLVAFWKMPHRCQKNAPGEERWEGKPYINGVTYIFYHSSAWDFGDHWGTFRGGGWGVFEARSGFVSWCGDATPPRIVFCRGNSLWILPFQGGKILSSYFSYVPKRSYKFLSVFQEEKPEYPLTVHGARRDSGFAKVGPKGGGVCQKR